MKLILGDCLEKLREMEDNSVDSVVTDAPYGLSFMGKKWDYDVPSTDIWRECLRVLKPGGHLLCFASSRTYHRMAVNIEDAGFEIRDQLMWIYGSGFPKSHNIGKAVDKKLGNDREVVGENPNHRTSSALYELGFQDGKGDGQITKGNSEWEGWGTALKPAHEPIVMARKPLSEKTIVDNVLEWGTGGINIDESRIPFDMNDKNPATNPLYRQQNEYKMPEKGQESKGSVSFTSSKNEIHQEGRFPANVLLSEEAAENLDQHTDNTSRYFYIAKVSKKERNFGMDEKVGVFHQRPRREDGTIIYKETHPEEWKEAMKKLPRKDKTSKAAAEEKLQGKKGNTHPTVKPIKLMEYLIKMVTPVGGITLDPFMGSGSTGIAALQNGFDFIGIEREQEYMDIAEQRINASYQTKLDI